MPEVTPTLTAPLAIVMPPLVTLPKLAIVTEPPLPEVLPPCAEMVARESAVELAPVT